MKNCTNTQGAPRRTQKIKLQDVTGRPEFAPAPCYLFPEPQYDAARRALARVLRRTSRRACAFTLAELRAQMVCGDIPTPHPGARCNAITCLAYTSDRHGASYTVSAYDAPATTYAYIAVNGAICVAQFSNEGDKFKYYSVF